MGESRIPRKALCQGPPGGHQIVGGSGNAEKVQGAAGGTAGQGRGEIGSAAVAGSSCRGVSAVGGRGEGCRPVGKEVAHEVQGPGDSDRGGVGADQVRQGVQEG